jgi:hypothetical protein
MAKDLAMILGIFVYVNEGVGRHGFEPPAAEELADLVLQPPVLRLDVLAAAHNFFADADFRVEIDLHVSIAHAYIIPHGPRIGVGTEARIVLYIGRERAMRLPRLNPAGFWKRRQQSANERRLSRRVRQLEDECHDLRTELRMVRAEADVANVERELLAKLVERQRSAVEADIAANARRTATGEGR